MSYSGRTWKKSFLLLSLIVLAYAGLLSLEGVAISWIDRWLPVTTFESATWAALFVTACLTWCRLCLLGIGIWLILGRNECFHVGVRQFALIWAFASAMVAGAMLAVDLWQHTLQYGGDSYSGDTVRSILLLLVYTKILLVYPGVRLMFGVVRIEASKSLVKTWGAVVLVESIKLFLLLVFLKMTIESVLVTAISYMPFIAPFWFIPDELSRMRFFVGQGTRIIAESLGVLLYITFFVAVAHAQPDIKLLLASKREDSR